MPQRFLPGFRGLNVDQYMFFDLLLPNVLMQKSRAKRLFHHVGLDWRCGRLDRLLPTTGSLEYHDISVLHCLLMSTTAKVTVTLALVLVLVGIGAADLFLSGTDLTGMVTTE